MGLTFRSALAAAAALAMACSSSGKQGRDAGSAVRDAATRAGDAGGASDGAAGDAGDAGDGGASDGGAAGAAAGDAGGDMGGDAAGDAGAAAGAFGYRVDAAAAKAGGTVKIIVRWPDTPQARRASPGDNECGKPRAPSVVPDELWGIPEAVVLLDVPRGKALAKARPISIAAERCAFSPRVALARPGARLLLGSRDGLLHTARVLAHPWRDGRLAPSGGKPRALRLPWRGHRVELSLAEPAIWQLELSGKHAAEDAAWLVVPPHPYAALTDRAGATSFSEVPAGDVPVTAWIPARGGGKPLELHGKVTVTANQTTELILTPTTSSAPPRSSGDEDEPPDPP